MVKNTQKKLDFFIFHLSLGPSNSSSVQEEARTLDTVKTCVYSGAFLVTGLLTCLIVLIVLGTRELRQNMYYILLCQHCVCVTGFNVAGALLHGLRSLQAPTARLLCWLIFDVQVALARTLVISLTAMAVNVSLAVCFPLRYAGLVRQATCRVMLLIWLVALVNPVLFTVLLCVQSRWEDVVAPETHCSTALDGFAARMSSIALLALLVLLFVLSYMGICVEGCKRGHFSLSNKKAQCTICIHALQLSLHILPAFVIIARVRLSLTASVLNFLLLCTAQSLSPVVYGLRCHDIRSQVPMFLPGFLLLLWRCFGCRKFCRSAERTKSTERSPTTATEPAPTSAASSTHTATSSGVCEVSRVI